MNHSLVTKRRLRDGAEAMNLEVRTDVGLDQLIDLRNQLHDGIAALQSLDDLGSEEANQRAWDDMLELQKRYAKVEKQIKKLRA